MDNDKEEINVDMEVVSENGISASKSSKTKHDTIDLGVLLGEIRSIKDDFNSRFDTLKSDIIKSIGEQVAAVKHDFDLKLQQLEGKFNELKLTVNRNTVLISGDEFEEGLVSKMNSISPAGAEFEGHYQRGIRRCNQKSQRSN